MGTVLQTETFTIVVRMALTHSMPLSPTASDTSLEAPLLPADAPCGRCLGLEVDEKSALDRRTRRLEVLVCLLVGLLAVRTLIDIRQIFLPIPQPTTAAEGGRTATPIPECASSSDL